MLCFFLTRFFPSILISIPKTKDPYFFPKSDLDSLLLSLVLYYCHLLYLPFSLGRHSRTVALTRFLRFHSSMYRCISYSTAACPSSDLSRQCHPCAFSGTFTVHVKVSIRTYTNRIVLLCSMCIEQPHVVDCLPLPQIYEHLVISFIPPTKKSFFCLPLPHGIIFFQKEASTLYFVLDTRPMSNQTSNNSPASYWEAPAQKVDTHSRKRSVWAHSPSQGLF